MSANLISPEYLELQRDLHKRYNYGRGADALECAHYIRDHAPVGTTVLDYGCGQGHLGALLRATHPVWDYDPCIPGKDYSPPACRFVVCADVLEHIEPELLTNVLEHIANCTLDRALFIVATKPSNKVMRDGRQAHVIVEEPGWWHDKIAEHFRILEFYDRDEEGKGVKIVARPWRADEKPFSRK